MPTDFFLNQPEYTLTYQENAQIEAEFSALDLVSYSGFGNDTMPEGYTSYTDHPNAPQFETALTDRYLEVWWDIDYFEGVYIEALEVRDTEKASFLGVEYPNMLERCQIYVEGENIGTLFTDNYFEQYGTSENLTITVQGTYLRATILLKANGTYTTINESWENNVLDYSITYEIDFEAMKPSAFLLIGRLLTFQNPDFGLPNELENIIGYGISLGIWITVALITYTIITKLLPTVQGGIED